jgi:hypothetical protein
MICRRRREDSEMGPWLVDVRSRKELQTYMGAEAPITHRPVVMVVRGDSPVIREFIPNALDAAKLDERRLVVWVKGPDLLTPQESAEYFGNDGEALAAVLSTARRVTALVHRDRIEVEDADFAFSTAEQS